MWPTLPTAPLTAVCRRILEAVLDDVWAAGLDVVGDLTGVEMFASPFMQRAYLAAICIAFISPMVGSFLVHREMAMIGDTLAHSAFAVTVPPLLTALVVAAVAALLVQTLVDHAGAYRDAPLAIAGHAAVSLTARVRRRIVARRR
jgi:zinc transport system permease protein